MSSLSITSSLLNRDISDITKNHTDTFKAIFNIEAKLHTVNNDFNNRDGIVFVDMYVIRDYVENMADYIEIKLMAPLGTFLYDIYPYLDNIEVTVITTKQLYKKNDPIRISEKYKAIYLLDKNSSLPNVVSYSKHDLDNQLPIVITLQLLDRSAETIRIKTTQGNFDKSINGNADMGISGFLKSVISEQVNKILIESKPVVDSFNIETPDNKDQLKSVTIPSYTRVVELPDYIQNKNIGVYNAGIGLYIQKFGTDHFTYKKSLFIYSLYNGEKYEKSDYKIIFFSPITSAESITDNTYKYQDKILKILPHSITKINDNKETSVMSSGGGFRMSNANSYMKKPVEMTVFGPRFKKESLNSEVIFKNRLDGLNFAPNKSVSNNQFALTSEILKKNGSYITIEISNMDHDFIYPGAKCKIIHEDKNKKITEIYGVIHKAYVTYSNNNMNLPMNYSTKTVSLTSHISLQVFCNSF